MKVKKNTIALILFLSIPMLSFIIDGIIAEKSIIAGLLLCAILLSTDIEHMKIRLSRSNCYWVLYVVAILLSLYRGNISKGVLTDVIVIILMLVYFVVNKCSWYSIEIGYKYIFIWGLINSFAIWLQLLNKEWFTSKIFAFYNTTWSDYMREYLKRGYFSGIQPIAGTAAGIISLSIVIMLIPILKNRKIGLRDNRIVFFVVFVFLFVSLLATGKKGILLSGFITIVLLAMYIYRSNKRWIEFLSVLVVVPMLIVFLRLYALDSSNSILLYRWNKFFVELKAGEGYDSNRLVLYKNAFNIWKHNPIMGIGWRRFRDYTTTVFGFRDKHDVNFDYLQFLCEMGLVGFTLILITISINLYRTFYILKSIEKKDFTLPNTVLYAIYIQIFTVIYAIVEVPFYDRSYFFPIYVFSSICISKYFYEIRKSNYQYG